MTLILKPDEVCPYSDSCKFSDRDNKEFFCRGLIKRNCDFVCSLDKNIELEEKDE